MVRGTGDDGARQAIERLGERFDRVTDDIAERVDGLVVRIGKRFDSLEEKIEVRDEGVRDELRSARADLVQVRDLVALQAARIDRLERIPPGVRIKHRLTMRKVVAFVTGAGAFGALLDNLPAIIRWWNAFWEFLAKKH